MNDSTLTWKTDFCICDYTNTEHCQNLIDLINHYMADPMGDSKPLTHQEQLGLIEGLANHPASFVLFAITEQKIVGLTTCFINFSTFKVKPYINIHDVIVRKEYRGKGIGRSLLQKCIDIARERNYCKITLEVRDDNTNAKNLYNSLGFRDSKPVMHFWTKTL